MKKTAKKKLKHSNLPKPKYARGEVFLVNCEPPFDKYEIGKIRPGVNIQEDIANELSPNVTFVPFSASNLKRNSLVHIPIGKGEGGVNKKCFALCDQIRTISKARVIGRMGSLKKTKMDIIDEGIKIHLDLT